MLPSQLTRFGLPVRAHFLRQLRVGAGLNRSSQSIIIPTAMLRIALPAALAAFLGFSLPLSAQTPSLQDIGSASWEELPEITIYPAKEILTLDSKNPQAEAVAVVGKRILAAGTLEELNGGTIVLPN